jgi:O-antigen/teichoic acid export membrane protein
MNLGAVLKTSLFKSAGIYGGLNIFRQLIPFLLLPIITHYLTPADYGTLAMFNIMLSLLFVFISLNVDSSVAREYFERDKIDFPKFVGNCLGIGVICTLVLIPVFYFFGYEIEKVSGVSQSLYGVILIIGFCRFLTQIILIIWQSGERAFSYSALQMAQIISDSGLTLIFILLLNMGLQGRIDAILYSGIIVALAAVYYLWRGGWVRFGYSKEYVRMALWIGVPLIPHVLGAIVISMADRVMIMNMLGAEDAGYYTIGLQIGNTLSMAVWAFNQAWSPWLYGKLKGDDCKDKVNIVRFSYAYFIVLIFSAVALSLVAPILFKFFIAPSFHPGLAVVPWIAVGAAFTGMYYMVCGYIIYARKTHILSLLTCIAGTANIVVSYFMILKFGYVGAAQGSLIGNLFLFLLAWWLASRAHPMPWVNALRVKGSE